jgi:hypothetical protein
MRIVVSRTLRRATTCGVQHWLKVLHRFRGAEQRSVGDPHRLGAGGEPLMRPAYEPGDLALIYVAGTFRCPAVVEVVAPAAYDATQARWGWRTEVRLVAEVSDPRRAPTLESIGVPARSVGRQSRLRLRPEQFAAGLRAIEARRRRAPERA